MMVRRSLWPLLVCITVPCTLLAHGDLDRREAVRAANQPWPDPPPVMALRFSALGYRHLAADMMWLSAVQYYGTHRNEQDNHFRLMVPIIHRVVALDPLFEFAYRFAGTTAVGPEGQHLEEVSELLRMGEAALPDVWRLPYVRAANCLQYGGKPSCVVEGFAAATRTKGSPEWLTLLAGRALNKEGRSNEAFELLARLAENTEDPMLKLRVQERLADMQLASDLKALKAAVVRYRQRQGEAKACPDDLGALLDNELLKVPESLMGGIYKLGDNCEPKHVHLGAAKR